MDSFLASGVLRGLQLRKFEVLTFGVSHSAAFLAHAQTLPNSKKRCLTLMEDTVITLSQGWFKASVSVILFFGSTVSIFFTKSIAVWKQMDLAVKQKRRLSKAVAYLVSTSTFFSFFFFFFFGANLLWICLSSIPPDRCSGLLKFAFPVSCLFGLHWTADIQQGWN